jgi:hypothetical protein
MPTKQSLVGIYLYKKGISRMARKHFDDYYNKIYMQFYSLQEVFDDLSKEVAEGMVEPERLTELEKTILPVKNNYQTLSYIKYLLDMPTRKEKEAMHKRMNKKLLKISEGRHGEDILKENKDVLESLKN